MKGEEEVLNFFVWADLIIFGKIEEGLAAWLV